MPEGRTPSPGYQIFVLLLSVFALTIVALPATGRLTPATTEILQAADFGICVLFLGDFLWQFATAPNRARYFFTWGWVDLLSSIPAVDMARWGRLARVLRVFRVLRGVRVARLITNLVMHRRAENAALAASMIALTLVTSASIAILYFEDAPESNIKTAGDAVWWAIVTITTVGYGDRFPVTMEGRLIAILLMTAGVGLFGTFSAFLAAWFIGGQNNDANRAELALLRAEIAALRASLPSAERKDDPRT